MARVKGEHLLGLHSAVVTPWNEVSRSQTVRATLNHADLQLGDAAGPSASGLKATDIINRSGSVAVTGGNEPTKIVITAEVRGGSQRAVDRRLARLDSRLRIGEIDGVLVVRERRRALGLVGGRLYPKVDVEVSAPEQTAVKYSLTTVDAPVTAKGIKFAAGSELRSTSGDATAEQASGNVTLETSSGAARLDHYTGSATAKVGNGRFEGVDVKGDTTVQGDTVQADYWHGEGTLTVKTAKGATIVSGYLPPEDGHEHPVPTDDDKRLAVTVEPPDKGFRKGPTKIEHVDATMNVRSGGPVVVRESLVRGSTVIGNGAPVVMEQVAFIGTNVVKNTGDGGISVVLSGEDPIHVVATTVAGKAVAGAGLEVVKPETGDPTDHFVANRGPQQGNNDELVLSADRGSVIVALGNKAA